METDKSVKPNQNTAGSSGAQNRLIALCWVAYTVSYLGRYSFSSNITNIMDYFGVTHAEAGLVTTFFFFAYGAGQFINGVLCKKYNKKIVFPAVLVIASVANVAVFAGVPFGAIKYIWLANGIVQSVLWSSIVSILAEYLDARHLRISLAVLGSTTAAGTFITYFTGFLFTGADMFMFIFLFAAVVMTTVAIVWAFRFGRICNEIKSSPPMPRDGPADPSETGKKDPQKLVSVKSVLAVTAVFAGFAVVCNFLKDGLQTWVPGMIKEIYGLDDGIAILVSLILPLLSAFCGVFTSFAGKRVKNTIILTALFFAACTVFSVLLKVLIGLSFVVSAILFGLIAFLSHCINTCITVIIPLKFRDTGKSGLLSGILNGCCYLGSTASAYGLGLIADNLGWDAAILILIFLSLGAAVLGLLTFRLMKKESSGAL